jgi:antitoxin (DNA-binding transcriptional repressor) of toxin-antitoxin stability system
MKTIEKSDATDSLAKYAEHAEDFPLVITEHGQPVAALLAVPNADLESVSLSTNPEFLALIDRSREWHGKEGGISSQEMRRRLGVPHGKGIDGDQ